MREGLIGDESSTRGQGPRARPMPELGWDQHVARVLELDPDLASRVSPQRLADARANVLAPVRHLGRGKWEPGENLDDRRTPAGLLVLDGMMLRSVCLDRCRDVEVIGPGDVLSPWRPERGSLPERITWAVVEDVSVAVLDRTFETACAYYPSVLTELAVRATQRAQRQALQRAMSHLRGLDSKLLALLWHLADRWGRVERAGVVLELRLSHEVLADLLGARRPSVSKALTALERAERIECRGRRGWLLLGLPPESFSRADLSSARLPGRADAETVSQVTVLRRETVS